MKKIIIAFTLFLSSITINAQHFEVDTLAMTGEIDQRINLVFLSDGYQENQLDKFITDARWMMDAVLDKPPYSRYRNYFNCFAIKVPSAASGAANDPDSLINNYFGSTFNYAGIWRLVVPTRTNRISQVLAENFPQYDQVFMVVNDDRYGGSGGWIATSTVHTAGPEICIHELGHSFAGLSDEYWAGQVYARENINMTQVTDTSLVKWKRWLGFSSTGIYPHEESPAWYRPHQNCEMRYLDSNFCPVCKEAIVSRILDLTSPILSYFPPDSAPVITKDTVFRVSLLAPSPNTLKTWWELNRNEIAVQTDSVRLTAGLMTPGPNNLTCFIIDTTSYIRDASHPTMHLKKVIWEINNLTSGIDINVRTDQETLSIFPNPATDVINVTYKTSQFPGSDLKIRLIDASGKSVMRAFSAQISSFTNEYRIPLPRRQLPAGLYYLLVQSSGHLFRMPVIIGN